MKLDKVCYIVGAGDFYGEIKKKNTDLVIAADAGLIALKKTGVVPDLIVGDFDSLGFVPDGNNVIQHPVMKDDTDTMLAVKTGFERGFDKFVILGGTGKKLSHTFANIQTLSYISQRGGTAFLIGGGYTVTALTNSAISFGDRAKGRISVFCNGRNALGVNENGLLYSLENAELSSDFPLGVSNEFTGVKSSVSVKDGTLIIIWDGTFNDII